jgi:hypothetical protein
MMDVRDLLVLPADDVPYESLDGGRSTRARHARRGTLHCYVCVGGAAARRDAAATRAAHTILLAPWDRHLAASALTILIGREPEEAIGAMRRLITDDPVLLEAMLEAVLTEPAVFANHHDFVHALVARVGALPAEDFDDLGQRSRFLATYR